MDTTSDEYKLIDAQYQAVKSILVNKASLADRFQLATIILSVFTSGSLWFSLARLFPNLTLWLGATLSTVTAGITMYIKASGINKIREDALLLERDILQYLGRIRDAATPPEDFSTKHKDFVSKIDQLRYGKHG